MLGAEGVALGRGPVLLGREAIDLRGLMIDVAAEVVDLLLVLLLLLLLFAATAIAIVVPNGGSTRRRRFLQQV